MAQLQYWNGTEFVILNSAAELEYDNSQSTLESETIQTAIDELDFTKVDEQLGKGLSTEDYTTAEKNKLALIQEGATNYQHPINHPASIITQDSNNRFMTDAERNKLAGIEPGATADMTAAEILTAIKTVDGSGSGLDSDLLDGQHSGYYAPIGSPSFTGVPTAPTALNGTNTTQIATTEFVQNTVSAFGSGDMLKSTYDPTNKNSDAFNMDNMTSGITNKVVTESEKTTWNSKQDALPTGTTSQFLRGDKTFQAVTKTNVGLESVQNYGIATQLEAETATSNVKYMTPLRTEQAITKLARKGAAIIFQSTEPTEAQIAEYWYRIL